MTNKQFFKFISYLIKNYQVYGPQEKGGQIFIKKLTNPEKVVLDKRLPFYSFKKFFLPKGETLFEYRGADLQDKSQKNIKKSALFGVNLLDLKAVLLYSKVFEKDPYYQTHRQNTLIIAHSFVPEPEDNIFEEKYEEDILKHLDFDIFLASFKNPSTSSRYAGLRSGNKSSRLPPERSAEGAESKAYTLFTGSLVGQKVLNDFGYRNYRHIQFSGPKENSQKRMEVLRDKLKNHHNPKIWQELGKICIECGKCSIVCPTCFCFRIDDQPSLEKNQGFRQRSWDSCFYQEFSEVAGGAKFLKSTAERIHFWYYHKFARIPDEYSFMGCVGCRRCSKVCPVGIDIVEVLKKIEKS